MPFLRSSRHFPIERFASYCTKMNYLCTLFKRKSEDKTTTRIYPIRTYQQVMTSFSQVKSILKVNGAATS